MEEYLKYLEERYENLRKKRIPVTGVEGKMERSLLLYHNNKIKTKMERLKFCMDNVKYYMEKGE